MTGCVRCAVSDLHATSPTQPPANQMNEITRNKQSTPPVQIAFALLEYRYLPCNVQGLLVSAPVPRLPPG